MSELSEILPIGDVARHTGIKVPTIRYYEQIGLLPAPGRTEGNRRCYSKAAIRRLTFIRHARELGFEIDSPGLGVAGHRRILRQGTAGDGFEADRLAVLVFEIIA